MAIANAIVARAKNFAGLDSVPMFPPVISAFLWSELIIIQHQAADTESRYAKENDTFAQHPRKWEREVEIVEVEQRNGIPHFFLNLNFKLHLLKSRF
jgi:hypothetical protein